MEVKSPVLPPESGVGQYRGTFTPESNSGVKSDIVKHDRLVDRVLEGYGGVKDWACAVLRVQKTLQ
jgi:hypothetical protein